MSEGQTSWWWCLKHDRVEGDDGCSFTDRLGPYPTPEAAANWKEQFAERNARWDAEE
jgi:hypothetical protein